MRKNGYRVKYAAYARLWDSLKSLLLFQLSFEFNPKYKYLGLNIAHIKETIKKLKFFDTHVKRITGDVCVLKFKKEKTMGENQSKIPALRVSDLTLAYREKPVLWDIDVEIPQGVMEAVIGPNGAGKSTFLKAVMGILPLAAGNVEIFGKPFSRQRRRVAYVPQRSAVDWDFPTTVFDVVLMGSYGSLGWIKRPGKREKEAATKALEKVGMTDFSARQISELSGGQQQRVFLARALIQEADLYFMDEPFQGVDAATERALVVLLKELKAAGKTLIVVHHDLQTVKDYFDRVLLLNVKLIAEGELSTTFTEENLRKTYGGHISSAR